MHNFLLRIIRYLYLRSIYKLRYFQELSEIKYQSKINMLWQQPIFERTRLWTNLPTHAVLTHWAIGQDNGLSPGRRQAIIWTNDGILLIVPVRTNFNEILIEICKFSFKKIHFNMSSGKWQPSWLGLYVWIKFHPCWKCYSKGVDESIKSMSPNDAIWRHGNRSSLG